MIRNDYIMRLVELLGAFMVRLIKQIDMGDFIGANEEVDEMAKKTVGLPLSVLENNQADNLIVMFTSGMGVDYLRIFAAATLLDVRGQIAYRDGNDISAFRFWNNAAFLFVTAAQSPDEEIKNRCDERLNSLIIRLKEFEIPASLHLALAKHCEEAGDFANAEEHLYEGLTDADKKGEILQEFYERLLELPDVDLEKGNLPRKEILDGLAELESA